MQSVQKGKILYIQLEGEIDHHSAQYIRESVDMAFDPTDCRQMIFDFSGVTFMDSSGIGMIIGRYKNAKKRGGTISIAGMSPEIGRIFQISGLAKIIDSYPSVEAAEKAVSNGQALPSLGRG